MGSDGGFEIHLHVTRSDDFIDIMGKHLSASKTPVEIIVAAAFLDNYAIQTIEEWLSNEKTAKIRLLTGVMNRWNRKRVFRRLYALAQERPKLEVRISRDERFHWKFFGLISDSQCIYFIGSANFTEEGCTQPGDVMFEIRLAGKEQQGRPKEVFDIEWSEGCSRILDNDFLESYEESRLSRLSPLTKRLKKVLVLKEAATPEKKPPDGERSTHEQFFFVSTNRNLTKLQTEAIERATRWPHRDFCAISGKDAGAIRPGDHVVWFHLTKDKTTKEYEPRSLGLREVQDKHVPMSILEQAMPVLWNEGSPEPVGLKDKDLRDLSSIIRADWENEGCLKIRREQWLAFQNLESRIRQRQPVIRA